MTWREVQKDEVELLRVTAGFGRAFPAFYQEAANNRHATEEDMLRFYSSCARLFGLFTDDRIVGLAYFQAITPEAHEVHFEMERGTDPKQIEPCIAGVRDKVFADGLRLCMAWVLKRNLGIQQMLIDIGFRFSGLDMKLGVSHGRVLRWTQMVIHSERRV